MKGKVLSVAMIIALTASLLAGCGGTASNGKSQNTPAAASNSEAKYKDGIYFAQGDKFDEKTGWKSVVTIEVKDGKISSVDFNGANVKAGDDKKTTSENGKYGMKTNGKAQAEWHEEIAKAEQYLIDKQDPTAITYKDDAGHVDSISGCTVSVKEYFELAKKALDAGPVGKGKYTDGAKHAEAKEFDSNGYKDIVDLTVINGYIVAANWNPVDKNGKDKKTLSKDGKYPMVAQGKAKAEWYVQAANAEKYLLEKQDPTITYKDDEGHTDAISGVSIHVKPFFTLAAEALKE